MVLILSNENDSSTTDVIEWLEYFEKKYIRINSEDILQIHFNGDDIQFKNKNESFLLSDIKSFWYRRGKFKFIHKHITEFEKFNLLQKNELNKISEFIYYRLKKINHINSISDININKLIVSHIARELKISTPIDFLFSNKKSINNHLRKTNEKYLTKTISGDSIQHFDDFTIINYSKILEFDKINTESFFPSLVQNYIQKKYELRIFYLKEKFYSMAIFSQNDSQTNIDFRIYNIDKPNRTVPFKLPDTIEGKLKKLMQKLKLNSGSIDMIVTPNNNYVFLEVNPIGQFGMTSHPCNYNLEKIIAESL